MLPWKQSSFCECSSSVAGTWSRVFCGVRGNGGSCRAWGLHGWVWRSLQMCCTRPGTVRQLALKLSSCTCLYCWGVHSEWKEKLKVIHEVKISPFPITPKGKQSLPGLRLVLHHCCLCAFLRASASADCSGLQSVSRLLLAGDSAICELHWRDCELCVSTFNVHQAPISFVRPVASSVILIASTFQVQLQLQAVMLQGCP